MSRWLSMAPMLITILALSGCPGKGELKPDAKADAASPARIELQGAWEQDVKVKLTELIQTKGKASQGYDQAAPPLVVFDFDNTSIRGDIGRAFFDWMSVHQKFQFTDPIWEALPDDKRAGIRDAWEAVQKLPEAQRAAAKELQEFRKRMHQAYWSLCHEADADKCYPWQVRFYAGYTPDEVRAMAAEVFTYELGRKLGSEPIRAGDDDPKPAITSTGIRVHAEIKDLMKVLAQQGFDVWVVTAGPQWVVQAASTHFPIKAEKMIGMRTKLVDGKLTTEMEPPPTFRQGKVDAIKQFIGKKPVLVLGDSWTDAEMMEYADHAILIDRGYADLRKKAFEAGWWIQPAFPVK